MCHKINYVAYIRHQKRVQQFSIISTLLKMQFLKLGGICCMGTYQVCLYTQVLWAVIKYLFVKKKLHFLSKLDFLRQKIEFALKIVVFYRMTMKTGHESSRYFLLSSADSIPDFLSLRRLILWEPGQDITQELQLFFTTRQ